jgi:hypothetical protein
VAPPRTGSVTGGAGHHRAIVVSNGDKPPLRLAWSGASPELLRVTRRWANIAGVLITVLMLAIIVGIALPSPALLAAGILLLIVVLVAYWRWGLELNARARWEYQQRVAGRVAGERSDRGMPTPPHSTKFMIAWCCANIAAAIGVAGGVPVWVFLINVPLLAFAIREYRRDLAARGLAS